MGVGVPRVPKGNALDSCRMDVPDVTDICPSTMVRHGRICIGVDTDGGCVPAMPKGHLARNCDSVDEVNSASSYSDLLDASMARLYIDSSTSRHFCSPRQNGTWPRRFNMGVSIFIQFPRLYTTQLK